MERLDVRQLDGGGAGRGPVPLDPATLGGLAEELGTALRTVDASPLDGPPRPDGDAGEFEAMLADVGIGWLHLDLGQRVLSAGMGFCGLVGRSVADVVGSRLSSFAHAEDADRIASQYHARVALAAPFRTEVRFVHATGGILRCSLHIVFRRDPAGRAMSCAVLVQDITTQRAVEEALGERADHYRHRVELAPQISWVADANGSICELGRRWADVTGGDPRNSLGDRWREALHPDDLEPTNRAWAEALTGGLPVDIEYRLYIRPGGYRWFRARGTAHRDDAGNVVCWYGTLEDVNDRKLTERALRDSEERFRLAAQAAGLGIWDYDAIGDRREWSPEFKSMLGLDADVLPDVKTALARVVPEDRHLLTALVTAVNAGDSAHQFEVMLRIRRANDGAERWMKTAGWRIQAPSGTLGRVLVTVRDVTDERTAADRLRWTGTHDALTRLPNRAYFNECLDAAITRAHDEGTSLALILFDVDHLKDINDSVGHDAGDALLRTLASRLHEALGNDVVLGRLGGDEFAVFLAAEDEACVVALVRAALMHLREPFAYDGHALDCQTTAGASLFPRDGRDAPDLLKAADIALYAGKAKQRGTLCTFRPDMRSDVQRRASMIGVARAALREDRVEPFYQPKVALEDGRLIGFEALLRWRHDQFGIQTPDTIAAAFDDFELAVGLSDRMLARIIADLCRWRDLGLNPGHIAFNLSAAEFRHDDLVERILGPLRAAGIAPSMLELEVTETVFVGRGAEAVGQMLAAFHDAGMRIALDDFGTGFASLTHLKAFPVDVIKIDRSFVANLCDESGSAAIVDAIVGLGQRLGMEVVAEGVETLEQARYLLERGCPSAQGYLYGRAMPVERVDALLREQAVRRAVTDGRGGAVRPRGRTTG